MPPRLPSSAAADFVVSTFSVSSPVAMRNDLDGGAGHVSGAVLAERPLRHYRTTQISGPSPAHGLPVSSATQRRPGPLIQYVH